MLDLTKTCACTTIPLKNETHTPLPSKYNCTKQQTLKLTPHSTTLTYTQTQLNNDIHTNPTQQWHTQTQLSNDTHKPHINNTDIHTQENHLNNNDIHTNPTSTTLTYTQTPLNNDIHTNPTSTTTHIHTNPTSTTLTYKPHLNTQPPPHKEKEMMGTLTGPALGQRQMDSSTIGRRRTTTYTAHSQGRCSAADIRVFQMPCMPHNTCC